METVTLYSIGHGDRSLEELLGMLRAAGVKALVDVRAQPHSSRHPWFSGAALRAALEGAGMVYHWAGRQLGGHRPPRPGSRHLALSGDLRGYADFMESGDFRKGVLQLERLATQAPTAMLCAEREPAHCHRRLIADHLLLQGVQVVHLYAPGDGREHLLSPEARRDSADLVYDRAGEGQRSLFE